MKIIPITAVYFLLALAGTNASAGVSLSQTRLVFLHSESTKTITVRNSGSEVYLVQPTITEWGTNKQAGVFTVLPPLFRLEANSGNVLRVQRTGGQLPQDRESVFNFKVNVIPAGRKPESDASVSVSLGIGVKLFYRPEGLKINVKDAYGMLTFHRDKEEIVVRNPTPYYQTFSRLTLGGRAVKLDKSQAMLAPYSELRYPGGMLDNVAEWTLITDYGANSDVFHATVD